jgi:hypothetical protein
MLRFTTSLVTTLILLSGSAWAQVCSTRIPPGHYYCSTHNEICTHGMSTPEVNYNYNYRPNQSGARYDNRCDTGYSNGYDNRYGNRYRNDRKRARRHKKRRYRRDARRQRQNCR